MVVMGESIPSLEKEMHYSPSHCQVYSVKYNGCW